MLDGRHHHRHHGAFGGKENEPPPSSSSSSTTTPLLSRSSSGSFVPTPKFKTLRFGGNSSGSDGVLKRRTPSSLFSRRKNLKLKAFGPARRVSTSEAEMNEDEDEDDEERDIHQTTTATAPSPPTTTTTTTTTIGESADVNEQTDKSANTSTSSVSSSNISMTSTTSSTSTTGEAFAPTTPNASREDLPTPTPPREHTHRPRQSSMPRSFTVNGRPYFTLSRLGRGGSSVVYRVLSKEKTVCALKEIHLGQDNASQHVANYQSEIDLLTRLRGNPRVIELMDYEICLDRRLIYMVLECGTTDLDQLLRDRRRKEKQQRERGMTTLQIQLESESLLRHWWHEILRCVLVCHQHKVIHLDLKPSNFVSVDGRLKIIDFGIAKQVEANMTSVMSEQTLGTLNFMSPESLQQATGSAQRSKLNRGSDVWSLGCILFQLTYGRPPFDHLDLVNKVVAITSSAHTIEFPPHPNHYLVDVMRKCLQRNVQQRPTIEQLLQHGFLYPSAFPSITKQQLVDICRQLIGAQGVRTSNDDVVSDIYKQLRRGDPIDVQHHLFLQPPH